MTEPHSHNLLVRLCPRLALRAEPRHPARPAPRRRMRQPEHLPRESTGARPDRHELNRMLAKLASGDGVTVRRIDRLARSTFDLFGIVKRIVDATAQFRSCAEP